MKKYLLLSFCFFSFVAVAKEKSDSPDLVYKEAPNTKSLIPNDSYVVDEVLVVVYGPERTRVITALEVERLSIDGRKRTLQDLINEELVYQEALKYKIPIDESVIDRYIANIRKQYNLSLEEVKGIFKQSGYTYEEGREQLRMMYANNAMIENIITSRLHVPREDVVAYFEKHPVVQEAKYTLQMTLIPFEGNQGREEQKKKMLQDIKQGKVDTFAWRDPFDLKENEISEHMSFIKNMKVGDISKPHEAIYGFEVYRLVELVPQRTIPLESRYKEIENILRQPQFQKKYAEYNKSLYDYASIVYYKKDKHDEPSLS